MSQILENYFRNIRLDNFESEERLPRFVGPIFQNTEIQRYSGYWSNPYDMLIVLEAAQIGKLSRTV